MLYSIRPRAFLTIPAVFLAIAVAAPDALAQQTTPAPAVPPRTGASETITLFDGKSLNGWAGHFKHWSVDDGEIVGKNTEAVPVSTYLLTEKNYTDFRLTAKVKLVESEMHSGIAFWGRVATEQGDPATYAGHLVMFPSGWGMYDLYGRNGLPVDSAPPRKSASSTTGTTWRSWRWATAYRSRSTACQSSTGAIPSPTGSRPARSGSNSTRTRCRRRSGSKTW